MSCIVYTKNICGRHGDNKPSYAFKFAQNGVPIDISDYEFFIELRRSKNETIFYKLGNGLNIVDNELIWDFGDELTVPEGNYFYAIKLVENNKPKTVIRGTFKVESKLVSHV